MAKSARSFDDQLRRLTEPKDRVSAQEACAEVQKALAARNNLVVARAADVARELRLVQVLPALVAAFAAHMESPHKTDKGCPAKLAIARALHELDYDQTDVFERGIKHVQTDGWGGGDSAIGLRAACALALASRRHRKVLQLLLPLLVDPAAQVRAAAARAIASTGQTAAEPVLQLKVLTGDDDEEVLAECFASLLALGDDDELEFVAGFLKSPAPTLQRAAALGLGGCRVQGAFDALHACWTAGADRQFAPVLLLALATMRDDRAMEFLLSLIRRGTIQDATMAIQSLKATRPNPRTTQLLQAAVHEQNEPRLFDVLAENGR